MRERDNCISIIRQNANRLKTEFGVTGMCIFGSVARGNNRTDSDVDIIVDMPPKILLMSSLKIYLESMLNVSVDLVRRHSRLSQKFLNQISKDAVTIF